ncbi:MAG: hypothetical protein ACOVMN_09280 [Flexibacteraceae bacterium]
MEPPKEIHIEVSEKRDYHTRVLFAILKNILFVLILGYIFSLKHEGLEVDAFYYLLFYFLLSLIALHEHNKYFIVSVDVVGEDVRVLYKYKGEKSNRELRGNISEFDFKIRDVLLYKNKPFYIRIMFRGNVVVKQYHIDNWDNIKFIPIVKDISELKGTQNWKSKGFNLFW